MRRSVQKGNRRERTVSLTTDSAKELEVNASKVTEAALSAEIRLDLIAADEYVEKHGSFADFAREHFASDDDAV